MTTSPTTHATTAAGTTSIKAPTARRSVANVWNRRPSPAVQRLARPINMDRPPLHRRIVDSFTDRAYSRAGAIAAVLATDSKRRAMSMAGRLSLLAFGTTTIGMAVAVMLWNNIGPGPLDVFIGGIRQHTGLPLTFALWLTIGGLLVMATALGRRPGFGSIASPLIVGPVMQVTYGVLRQVAAPDSIVVQLGVHLLAVVAVGIGAGALIVSGLGAGSGELLAAAASTRSGRPEPRVRMAFELTWLSVGLVLGGPIGWGTVVVALAIGPAVATGTRAVSGAVEHVRRTTDSALALASA